MFVKENPDRKEIKNKKNNYFIEALYGNYEVEQKTREYEESDAYISVKGNLKNTFLFWGKKR